MPKKLTQKEKEPNRYAKLIEAVFFENHRKGVSEVQFEREDIEKKANELGITLPKNLGDVVYSFRYRNDLPKSITALTSAKKQWVILPAGISKYRFCQFEVVRVLPNPAKVETKIPNATPVVIKSYSFNDEQALLAKLRYNRLIDIFTGITCYSLQNHLRTTVKGMGQIEIDEIYAGIDKKGVHYIIPVQAKVGSDQLGIVQLAQDIELCKVKFPDLVCKPIGAQSLGHDLIALFELEMCKKGIGVISEKHYQLVQAKLDSEELEKYRQRTE